MRLDQSGATTLSDDLVDATALEQLWHFVRGQRRTFLVDRSYQLRVSFVNLTFMTLLLVPLLATYYFTLTAESEASRMAPELDAFFAAQDLAQFRLVLLASAVLLAGLFLVTLFETHRTAGAAFAIRRQFEAVRKGRLNGALKLRREDNLVGLETAYNEMVGSLREVSRSEASQLEALADDLDRSGSVATAREAAARLRLLADQKRANLG